MCRFKTGYGLDCPFTCNNVQRRRSGISSDPILKFDLRYGLTPTRFVISCVSVAHLSASTSFDFIGGAVELWFNFAYFSLNGLKHL